MVKNQIKNHYNSLVKKNDFITRWFDDIREEIDSFFNTDIFPSYNISYLDEGDKEYKLELALPGYDKSDLKVNVKNGVLEVSSSVEKESKSSYFRRSFVKRIALPDDVETGGITSYYKDGVLSITIPKSEKVVDTIAIEVK